MVFQIILFIVSVIAGSVASLAGFGIGSMLTPLLSTETGISIAVGGVSIVHFFGTTLRFFFMRKNLNKRVLLSFGLTSAAGGLVGALLHNRFQDVVLTIVLGCLLVIAGLLGLTGLSEKLSFKGIIAWTAGCLSGLFGGLVGNQGGIRSAALLGFKLDKDQFVATATGIALMVDVARMPVYIVFQGAQMASIWHFILISTVGVIIGTVGGKKILEKLPEYVFKKIVASIMLLVGILVLIER